MALRQHGPFVGFALAVCVLMGFAGGQDLLAQRPPQNPMTQTRYTPADLGYELVWKDDFKGDTLDPTKWEVRGVGPRALGFVSAEAVKVEHGYLKLSAFKKDGRILLGAV